MLIIVYLGIQWKMSPSEKEDNIISYEPSGRINYKDGLVDDIIVDESEVSYSRYYLFLLYCF